MQVQTKPRWWNTRHDTAWERARRAIRRDWDSAKGEFEGDRRNLDEDSGQLGSGVIEEDTPVSDAPDFENAHRFGVGARLQYGRGNNTWDEPLEDRLREEWADAHPDESGSWERFREAVRYGWDYETPDE